MNRAAKIKLVRAVSTLAIATIFASNPAFAQDKPDAPKDASAGDDIVITGSRLLTSSQADSLPLRVVSDEEIRKQGSPPLVDLIRAMPEVAGAIGNSNSSQPGKGQGFEGAESINLRGLGPDRDLVLLNGKRLPLSAGYFVNTRDIPMSAIARVEILKDAASTTYGSDAMTGVVNFITKRGFKGLEIGGDYTEIQDTNGDWRVDGTFGTGGERWDLLVSGGYQARARLRVKDRPWSTPPYSINPDAGWNFSSNPSQFTPVGPIGAGSTLAATGARTVDSGCAPLGGIQPFAGFCVNNVQIWQDLVAPAKTWQIYSEFNYKLGGNTEFHLEGYYSSDKATVDYPPSFNQPKPITATVLPSNMNTATAAVGTSPLLYSNWFVPMTNPGLAAYAAANPSQFPAGTTGIFIPVGQWRPYFVGGNPFFGDASTSAYQIRSQREFRVSAGLKGEVGDGISWNADFTYGQNRFTSRGFDSNGSMIELALRGLGGPNCQWQTATPGSTGCLWLNPMSNAIASAPVNGINQNTGYNASVANTKELADWLMIPWTAVFTSKTAEANFGLDGKLAPINVGAGPLKWAVGGQWRWLSYDAQYSEAINRVASPCLNSLLNIAGADTCTPTPYTPLGLAAVGVPTAIRTNVVALFGEAVLPLSKRSDLTVGMRYEDYGKNGGATFNPQARAKFQIFDWLAVRGSVGTTFRAPPQIQLAPNPVASIPNILGKATAVDLIGNPNLKPERATTYNLGLLVNYSGFDAGIDYYHYDVKDILTTEPQNAIVNALFPNGTAGPDNCGTLDPAFIASHFVFTGSCSAANVSKVMLLRINGPKAQFSGIDLRASYRTNGVFGGTLTVGGVANVTLKYHFDGFSVAGLAVAGFDAVGKLNAGTLAHTLPKWKVNGYVNYQNGPVNIRWTGRYYSTYIDQRQATTAIGYSIKGQFLNDLALNVELPWKASLSLAVTNVFDLDPPLARLPEGYDAMTSDPLGRTIRIGLRKKF